MFTKHYFRTRVRCIQAHTHRQQAPTASLSYLRLFGQTVNFKGIQQARMKGLGSAPSLRITLRNWS